jgi:hypothetical protein
MLRPVAAGVLTIVGGFFILAGGLAFAVAFAIFAVLGFVSGFFLLGLLVGALTILVGILMIVFPSGHSFFGIVAVALALTSILVALGGFIVGFLCALIGGILALRWTRQDERIILAEGRRVPPPSG